MPVTTPTIVDETDVTHKVSKEAEEKILKDIEHYCNLWKTMANWFNVGIVFFGVAAISTSVLVSIYTGSDFISDRALKILACISTISLALLTAFNLIRYSNDSRNAWRALNSSLMMYRAGIIPMKDLIKQYQLGETQMGVVEFNYNVNASQNGKEKENSNEGIEKFERKNSEKQTDKSSPEPNSVIPHKEQSNKELDIASQLANGSNIISDDKKDH
jgi:hypothetical protein